MRETHNSYTITYADCTSKDFKSLQDKAVYLGSKGGTVVKVTQGTLKDVVISAITSETMKAAGIDPEKPFHAKLIIKSPNSSMIDGSDRSSLGSGIGKKSLLRSAPFFFRQDGASVDLIDSYADQSAFLVLNGASLASLDTSLLSLPGVVTMGVNNGAHTLRPRLWTCVDDPCRFMPSIWLDPCITKIIPHAHFSKRLWDIEKQAFSDITPGDCPAVFGFRRNERFNAATFLTESTVNWGNHGSLGGGRSVMLSAVRLLYLLGFRTIYLVGCDFYMDAEAKYFFPEVREAQAISNNMNSYRLMMGYFAELRPHFEAAGLSVFNLNPESRLTVFPYMDYQEALFRATEAMRRELPRDTLGMYVKR